MNDKEYTFYQTIGERIREIRAAKGMSQAELAEKANLSLPVISTIENAKSKTWLITFAKVAEALEVSPNDILRLNTPSSSASFPAEITKLLEGCTADEAESIIRIIKQLRTTFINQKKKYSE